MFSLDFASSKPLVAQIVEGFVQLIESGALRTGTKAPSIRQFAHAHGVSTFTVVDAYDKLVAQGYFTSRPNQGFFVKVKAVTEALGSNASQSPKHFDSAWYLRRIFENRSLSMKPGCGWLPSEWLCADGVRRSLRSLANEGDIDVAGYGDPKGFLPLRHLVRDLMHEQEIAVHPEQILLTHGSSQAMDLVVRRLVQPGDVVLVDDPGYANLLFSLRLSGAQLLGVPRTAHGYDLEALEGLVREHQPKVFFTQPRLQSPTGSTAQLAHLHRVLQLADRHDFLIVENDIYADLDPEPRPSMASLDQLRRVIYISSFSKTVTPNLRVGFLLAQPDLLEELAQLKMISGLTSSEFGERLVYGALMDGRWRKHLRTLKERLSDAHVQVSQKLIALGFEIFCEPKAGMYLWARHPICEDVNQLAYQAVEEDIMLGPGNLFKPDLSTVPWMRFNVSFSLDERIYEFLGKQLKPSNKP